MAVQVATDDQAIVTKAVCAAAEALGLKRSQLARAIGVSEPTATRLRSGQTQVPEGKPFELSLLLIRAYRALYAILGGDKDSMKHWIKTPNHHLQDQAPAELIQKVDGMSQVVRYLDAMRGKV